MKHLKLIALLITTLNVQGLHAGVPTEVIIPVDDIYTPKGFDTNDNTEIVITGYLPNLCHKSPKVKSQIDGDQINVTLTSLKYDSTNPYCPEVAVPFVKTIDLGLMRKGLYTVKANEGSIFSKTEQLVIVKAGETRKDENIYPLVDHIEEVAGTRRIKIKGYNPSNCFELSSVEVISDRENTLSILPKMIQVDQFCPRKMTPFTYDVVLPDTLGEDTILLHVRSMNGNSVNKIYNNQ